MLQIYTTIKISIHVIVQDKRSFIANALELCPSCTRPSISCRLSYANIIFFIVVTLAYIELCFYAVASLYINGFASVRRVSDRQSIRYTAHHIICAWHTFVDAIIAEA